MKIVLIYPDTVDPAKVRADAAKIRDTVIIPTAPKGYSS